MKYEAFVELLEQDINNGRYDQDGKLPSEDVLIESYQVTRYTLRKAIAFLVERGQLYQVQGSGIYLRRRAKKGYFNLDDTQGITSESRGINQNVETKVVSLEEIQFKDAAFVPEGLSLSPETILYFVKRLRLLDGKPFVVEHSYYIKSLVPYLNHEIVEQSIFHYLKEVVKLKFGFADKIIRTEKLTQEVATLLELKKDDPTLVIIDEAYLANGALFNYSKLYYHYENSEFFMHATMK